MFDDGLRVHLTQPPRRCHCFRKRVRGIALRKQKLALEVRKLHEITIDQPKPADSSARKDFRRDATQGAASHYGHARFADAFLSLFPNPSKANLTGVTRLGAMPHAIFWLRNDGSRLTPVHMKRAAIGIRVHSGWGALVAISGSSAGIEVLARKRVSVTPSGMAGANQPYHRAKDLDLPSAERFLAECADGSARLADAALRQLIRELDVRHCTIAGCAILAASGRALPALRDTLASHAMIHTAEGKFFRQVFRRACEGLNIPVTAIREKEIDVPDKVREKVAGLGHAIGPPWTSDQKLACLAAWVLLTSATK